MKNQYGGTLSVGERRISDPQTQIVFQKQALLWLYPSCLFHPPTSVFPHESRVSQAQWGRKMLPLSSLVGGNLDDSPLQVALGLFDVRGALIPSGRRMTLPLGCLLLLGLGSENARTGFTSVG